ncbi:MAG: TIGR04013 family B12-binding domain/radical SAM domain-containing protein [Candidatus Lokiarchaeota archaeon]|nr:TIGR04013 family B12-binding domain/radical SAM domain-containing protein [Candidatus Lokiarchaeota archaeon]
MNSNLLFFRFDKTTKYSMAALIGAIENNELFNNLSIEIGSLGDLKKIIDKYNKVILAYSILSTEARKIQIEVEKIRNIFGDKLIIIGGGPHVIARPESTFKWGFDYLALGEGEKTFNELLYAILNDSSKEKIDGIYFMENDKTQKREQNNLINLDKYQPFSIKYRLFAPIEISRGCSAGNCLYCMVPKMYGNIMRHRGIKNITEIIKRATKKGYDKVWFNSPNSFAYGSEDGRTPNISKIVDLLSSIKRIKKIRKIFFGTFPGEVRPDSVNEEIVEAIKPYISNDSIIVGGQSASDRILRILRRNHSVQEVINAVEILLKYNITPKVDMIFGFYFEKENDEAINIEFMKKIIKKGAIIHAHTFMPLPGCALENSPPGKLSSKMKKFLGRWSKRGKIYGSWAYQEKLALELSKL